MTYNEFTDLDVIRLSNSNHQFSMQDLIDSIPYIEKSQLLYLKQIIDAQVNKILPNLNAQWYIVERHCDNHLTGEKIFDNPMCGCIAVCAYKPNPSEVPEPETRNERLIESDY